MGCGMDQKDVGILSIETRLEIDAIIVRAFNLSKKQPAIDHLKQLPHANEERYYWFLHYLASLLQPSVIVELGVYQGTSLAHLASGCIEAKVVGVDKDIEEPALQSLPPYPNIHIVEQDSVQYLSNYWGDLIDLLFIDTEHTPVQAQAELRLAWPHMVNGGVICIDDITISSEMKAWWHGLKVDKRQFPSLHSTGFGVIIRE